MNIKILTIVYALSATVLLSSCNKQMEVPVPAISFSEDAAILYQKETNKFLTESFIEEDIAFVQKNIFNHIDFCTPNNDTISYIFASKYLFAVLINCPNRHYDDVIKKFNSDTHFHKIGNGVYKHNTNIIKVGEREKQGCYFVYLNDEANEVSEYVELIRTKPIFMENLTKAKDGFFYIAGLATYYTGNAISFLDEAYKTGAQILLRVGCSEEFNEQSKYLNHIFKETLQDNYYLKVCCYAQLGKETLY